MERYKHEQELPHTYHIYCIECGKTILNSVTQKIAEVVEAEHYRLFNHSCLITSGKDVINED